MTQTAVAYTRGALSPVTKRRPAGPGKARAGAVRPDLAAQARVAAHQARADFTIEVWRSDDETVRDVSVDRLLGLQQALFLLRAGVVDALYVHDRNDVAAADLATVAAEVKACGRSLIVAGQRISSPHELCLAPELGELAEVGVRLRDTVTPRLNCRDRWHADEDLDIGSMDIKSDAARLAHKLRVEFSLPLNQVASLLDAASYCFRGVPLSWRKQTVDRLLRGAGEYISEEPLDDAWGVGRSADLFGDSRLRLIYAQHGWNGPSEAATYCWTARNSAASSRGRPGWTPPTGRPWCGRWASYELASFTRSSYRTVASAAPWRSASSCSPRRGPPEFGPTWTAPDSGRLTPASPASSRSEVPRE